MVRISSIRKEEFFLNFQTFYSILKNRISDGYDVPTFIKELIEMITFASEEEWGSKKDPSKRVSQETYRNYSKRGLPKSLAKNIVYRLTPENFIESINSRPTETLKILAQDIQPYDPSANENNVANILADIFTNIIKETAGLVDPNKLKEQKLQKSSENLKAKFGKYLLRECQNHCAMSGCGKPLFVSNGSSFSDLYEISRIDKNKNDNIDNLIALCPRCFSLYQIDKSSKTTKDLKSRKKSLNLNLKNILSLTPIELNSGLTDVIIKISKLKQNDLFDISLNPLEISEKINPNKDLIFYNSVKNNVATYYGNIKEIFQTLDKAKKINYAEIQLQMRAMYIKLKNTNKSQLDIFNAISGKLQKVTLQDIVYCQIIVCYFIQSCEVFDAITK